MTSSSGMSPFASTPLPTTTTTTRTSSTSDPRQRSQQQHPLPQKISTAPVIMNSSSSSSVPPPLYLDDGDLPEDIASYLEHWASPTEVLQLRTMCSDLINKYKNEAACLRRELEEVKKGRDALLLEVQETQKLRQLYIKSEEGYEKSRGERERWIEDRELLRLQLQRLSIENQRLQQILSRRGRSPDLQLLRGGVTSAPLSSGAGVGVGGSGSSGVAPTSTRTPTTTGSVIPTPSISSSLTLPLAGGNRGHQQQQQRHHQQRQLSDFDSGSAGNNSSGIGDDGSSYMHSVDGGLNGALREHLRLIEELHRCTTEYAELEARFHFSQTLWDITAARGDQRLMLLVAENEKLKGQVRHWRGVAEDNASRLDAVSAQLRDRCIELEEARCELQNEREEGQTVIEAGRYAAQDSITSIKAAHAEELARAQQQLQFALDDTARTREKLQGALDKAQRQAETLREELLAEVEAAEQKCGDALQAQRKTEAVLAEVTASHQQQRAQLEHELCLLQSAHQTCLKEKAEQSRELQEVREGREALTVRLHDMEEELRAVGEQLNAAVEKLQHSADVEEALVVAQTRAEEVEAEVQAQHLYYTEQLRIQQTALMEMQKKRDEEVGRLVRTIEKLQRRYTSSKIRLAAAARGIGRADAIVSHHSTQEQIQEHMGEERGSLLTERPVEPDVVFLLRQSVAIAATLARTIDRGTSKFQGNIA